MRLHGSAADAGHAAFAIVPEDSPRTHFRTWVDVMNFRVQSGCGSEVFFFFFFLLYMYLSHFLPMCNNLRSPPDEQKWMVIGAAVRNRSRELLLRKRFAEIMCRNEVTFCFSLFFFGQPRPMHHSCSLVELRQSTN